MTQNNVQNWHIHSNRTSALSSLPSVCRGGRSLGPSGPLPPQNGFQRRPREGPEAIEPPLGRTVLDKLQRGIDFAGDIEHACAAARGTVVESDGSRQPRPPGAITPPPRPRRQPPTQLRPPPDRHHPRPRARTRARLPRTQTERRQDTPRSHPLPQTPARPHHLHDTQKRAAIDMGATLAHAAVLPFDPFADQR